MYTEQCMQNNVPFPRDSCDSTLNTENYNNLYQHLYYVVLFCRTVAEKRRFLASTELSLGVFFSDQLNHPMYVRLSELLIKSNQPV